MLVPGCLGPYWFLAGGQMSEEVILLIDSLTDFTEQAGLSGEGANLPADSWSVLLLLGLAGGVAHDGLAQRNHFLVAFPLFSPPLVLPVFPMAYVQSRPLLILYLQLPAQQFNHHIHRLFGQTHLRHCLYRFPSFLYFYLHLAEMLSLHLPNFLLMLDLHIADFSVLLGAGFEVEGGQCGNLMIVIA